MDEKPQNEGDLEANFILTIFKKIMVVRGVLKINLRSITEME
jgi:hypothetical protein